MRLTSTGQLSTILRSNACRTNNRLQPTGSLHNVRTLTSGTYRVPKAFNEPNVSLTFILCSMVMQITDQFTVALRAQLSRA
jgi:hypothetical protein